MKKEFGDARRTEIVDEGVEFSIEDLIADEDVALTVPQRLHQAHPHTTYQRQGRAARAGLGLRKGSDFVEHLFIASTHAYLMIFTDDGTVYKIKVHEVPDAAASRAARRCEPHQYASAYWRVCRAILLRSASYVLMYALRATSRRSLRLLKIAHGRRASCAHSLMRFTIALRARKLRIGHSWTLIL